MKTPMEKPFINAVISREFLKSLQYFPPTPTENDQQRQLILNYENSPYLYNKLLVNQFNTGFLLIGPSYWPRNTA